MTTTTNTFKLSAMGRWLRASSLWTFLKRSQGDWRFPFLALSWTVARWLVPRRAVKVNGVSFTLPCHNWITHFRWYLFKTKEAEVRRYIYEYIGEGDVFFDIGANIGVFSVYAAKRHPGVACSCFEPEYSNLFLLKENIVHNALVERANIFSVAVGDFMGLSKLNLQDLTPGSAAHTESKTAIGQTLEGYPVVWTEGIVSVTLDQICREVGVTPNAMKIDTDGNEDKVLRGAADTLRQKQLRSLVIEMPESFEQECACAQMLAEAGFQLDWAEREKTRNQIWIKR